MSSNYLKAVNKLVAIKIASLEDYLPTEDEKLPSRWGSAVGTTAGLAAFAPFYLKGGLEYAPARGLNLLHPVQATVSLTHKLNPWGTGEGALSRALLGNYQTRLNFLKRLQSKTPSMQGIALPELYDKVFKQRRNWLSPGLYGEQGVILDPSFKSILKKHSPKDLRILENMVNVDGNKVLKSAYLKNVLDRTKYTGNVLTPGKTLKHSWLPRIGATTRTVPTNDLVKAARATTFTRTPKLGKQFIRMGKGRLGIGLAAAGLASYLGKKWGDAL